MSVQLNEEINHLKDNEDLFYEDSDDSSEDMSDENSEDESIEEDNKVIKKTRGRKPKPKDDTKEDKEPKKRGRKPKPKDLTEDKIPKKRGRKPKEKIYSVKELPKNFFDENKNEALILHLPIKQQISKNIDNNPSPNTPIDYSVYDNELTNGYLLPIQSNLINSKNENGSENIHDKFMFDNDNNYLIKNEEINNSINAVINNSIKNEKPEEDEIYIENDIKQNKVIKKNLRNILYEFINANNEKIWPETTNIHCWWCCHQFNNTPCCLPEYYKKDKFYVSGCFCSFNCTASYNFSKNDDNMWERFSLLNLMYKKLYNKKFVKISLAPPRETLKIFGGYLSIEEFRENLLKNDKTYNVIKPPLISIIPKIEENISNTVKNIKNNYPLINENILNKTQNTLKLKRNKPVTNPNNTLQSFMDLKIIV